MTLLVLPEAAELIGAAPRPTAVSGPFWAGCAEGELLFQRCGACERTTSMPLWSCRWCGADALSWEPSSGRGTIYSWSMVWRPRSPELRVPYAVVIADMEEGFQLLSNLGGCDSEELVIGAPVRVVFRRLSSTVGLPLLVPLSGAGAQSPLPAVRPK